MVGGLDGSNLGLFLCNALGDEDAKGCSEFDHQGKGMFRYALVLGLLLLLRLELSALEGVEMAAALEAEGGDEALDLGTR